MTEENYQIIIDFLRKDFSLLRKITENQWDCINKNSRQLSFLQKKIMSIESRLKWIEGKYKEGDD